MAPDRLRAWYSLAILCAINFMNFYDRQILPAVQERIRTQWELSDHELGLLGTAFILLYAVIGIPLGRLADVWRRKWVLAAGVALWSILTAASGLAWNFWSLFLFRLGVGVGEASCAPTASSLIGDLFEPARRARAMSIFMIGLPLGLGLSFMVSGTLAQRVSWQAAFWIAGLPGLLLALAALTIEDPVRGGADVLREGGERQRPQSFIVSVRHVLTIPTMWWIILSGAIHNFNMYALGSFLSSFLGRYHGVTVELAGNISGLLYGFAAVGMFVAGFLGDRAFRRHASGRLQVAWVALALAVPCLLLGLRVPQQSPWQFAAWLFPGCMLLYAYYGTVYATIQDIIEPAQRGMAMAVYFCAMYMLGAVLGPVATGWISDYFAGQAAARAGVEPSYSETGRLLVPEEFRAVGLHQAMHLIPLLCVFLVLVLIAASRTVTRDRERLASGSSLG
jgi:MFS family permease